ncbi:type IV pilus biogenesis protein PilM [Mariniblastus fucicola]|uniref:Competence protein A n=1 Tax=Mariniblastus fucicola TaxID=980251 RepID=A0A5B9PB77_9BACT|nr:hypothetical protein [Mariniblastus fucicola]QEG22445.1 Competence protein A [Mariniblastus fucicola]
MSIVAIEINPNRILLVAGRKATTRPLEISHAIEIPIESGLTDEAIGEKLKQVVQDNGLTRNDAVVVLSRSQSELREIELPPAPDDELPDMVMFKAKSDFASFSDRWLLDYVSLDTDPGLPRRVLASAIAPAVRERVEKIIEPTGLKLKQLVLRPFAIMDLLNSQISDDAARLVVNPGDEFTDIVVTKGNQTVSTRSIRMPADQNSDQRNRLLLSEVRRTLASSKRQLGGTAVSNMILLDDEKTNKHLVGDLSERLKIGVDVVNPFDGLGRIGQAKGDVASPWQFSPLLGSLLHHGHDRTPAIDFLNPSRREEVVVDRSRWLIYGSLAGLAALMTIAFAWWTLSSQSAEIAQLQQDLVDAIKFNEGDSNRPSMDSILGRTGMIDDWEKANVQWLDELDEMSKRFLTADEAMVSSFNAAVRRNVPIVEVSGKIVSNDQDRKLFEALELRPYLVTPTKADVSLEGDSEYPYTFGNSLVVQRKGVEWLKALDKHVSDFHKNRRSLNDEAAVDGESDADSEVDAEANSDAEGSVN